MLEGFVHCQVAARNSSESKMRRCPLERLSAGVRMRSRWCARGHSAHARVCTRERDAEARSVADAIMRFVLRPPPCALVASPAGVGAASSGTAVWCWCKATNESSVTASQHKDRAPVQPLTANDEPASSYPRGSRRHRRPRPDASGGAQLSR